MRKLRESRRGSSSIPTTVSNEELGNVSTVNVEVELNTRDEEVFTVNVEEELNTHDVANVEIEGDNENVNKEIHVETVDKQNLTKTPPRILHKKPNFFIEIDENILKPMSDKLSE